MKKTILLLASILFALTLASCEMKCRCYRYNGEILEFTPDELDAMGYTCTEMEDFDLGFTYSLCEKVF